MIAAVFRVFAALADVVARNAGAQTVQRGIAFENVTGADGEMGGVSPLRFWPGAIFETGDERVATMLRSRGTQGRL